MQGKPEQYQRTINAKNHNPCFGYRASLLGGSVEIRKVRSLGSSHFSSSCKLRPLSIRPCVTPVKTSGLQLAAACITASTIINKTLNTEHDMWQPHCTWGSEDLRDYFRCLALDQCLWACFSPVK